MTDEDVQSYIDHFHYVFNTVSFRLNLCIAVQMYKYLNLPVHLHLGVSLCRAIDRVCALYRRCTAYNQRATT